MWQRRCVFRIRTNELRNASSQCRVTSRAAPARKYFQHAAAADDSFRPAGFEVGRNRDQALSAPDALATWVAIASISGGERQSYGSSRSSLSRERTAPIWSGGAPI